MFWEPGSPVSPGFPEYSWGSGAAVHNVALRQVAHYPASGLRPHQRKLADLLPISPVSADFFCEGAVSDIDESLKFSHVKCCLAVLSSLNFLMGVGWTSRPILLAELFPLTVAQMNSFPNFSSLVAVFVCMIRPRAFPLPGKFQLSSRGEFLIQGASYRCDVTWFLI